MPQVVRDALRDGNNRAGGIEDARGHLLGFGAMNEFPVLGLFFDQRRVDFEQARYPRALGVLHASVAP